MRRLLLLILWSTMLFATDLESVIQNLNTRMAAVQDLQVEIFVRSRMPNMTVPDRTGTLYFKRPDKVYIDGSGFMMIPKEALLLDFSVLMQDSLVTMTLVEPDSLKAKNEVLVKVERIENNRLFLMNVIVDMNKWVISRISLDEGKQFKGDISFRHTEVLDGTWLPSEVKMTVEGGDKANHTVKNPRVRRVQKPDSDGDGYILLKFSDYKVNRGIDDSKFPEEEQE